MSNAMKYIRDLEAVGFERNQAEAQVQMVLDAIEGDLMTKSDLAVFKEQMDGRFIQVNAEIRNQVKDSELRLTTRLGVMMLGTATLIIAILTWVIKI